MAFMGIMVIVLAVIAFIVVLGWIMLVISMILRKKKKPYRIMLVLSLLMIFLPIILFVTAQLNQKYTQFKFNQSIAGAVYEGDIERAQKLLDKGADPNYDEYIIQNGEILKNDGGWTKNHPLNYACINNDTDMVVLLLQYNAKVDIDAWNDAMENNSYDAARLLLGNNGFSQMEQEEMLSNACSCHELEEVKFLLECGVDPFFAIRDGYEGVYLLEDDGSELYHEIEELIEGYMENTLFQ